MKNFIILIGVVFFSTLLAITEYLLGCPFEWYMGVIISGGLFLMIGLGWMMMLHVSKKKIVFSFVSGCILIAAVHVATNALALIKMLLADYPEVANSAWILLTSLVALYVPFLYVGAVWLYFYHFCDLRDVLAKMKQNL